MRVRVHVAAYLLLGATADPRWRGARESVHRRARARPWRGCAGEKDLRHLGMVRHRSEAVEYRIEQHAATLRDRLAALQGQAF